MSEVSICTLRESCSRACHNIVITVVVVSIYYVRMFSFLKVRSMSKGIAQTTNTAFLSLYVFREVLPSGALLVEASQQHRAVHHQIPGEEAARSLQNGEVRSEVSRGLLY